MTPATPSPASRDPTAQSHPCKISLAEWDALHAALREAGFQEPPYGGPLRRHVDFGRDHRLCQLRFDNSPAALRLWNLLLTEEDRLRQHRAAGRKLVGAMKDLGTVPVMAYSLPNLVAFYPDGAWWTPCLMECSDGLLQVAGQFGLDESFCPVRAMLGAFVTRDRFPIPDLLLCSVGAVCDDFSAIAQRVERLGHPILWWEMPRRRHPEPGEAGVALPGGLMAPRSQVDWVRAELDRVRHALESLAGTRLDDPVLAEGIKAANAVRRRIRGLRDLVFRADPSPLPALEMLIVEALAIHYCSDRTETLAVLDDLLATAGDRVARGVGPLPQGAARLFWVNPVADLRVMNLVEDCGGRVCGCDYLFGHAFMDIPEDYPPLEALARAALADPMVGSALERARSIVAEMRRCGAEAVVISRIPGASHCAGEGEIIRQVVHESLGLSSVEIEVPPLSDAILPGLRSRLSALIEGSHLKN